jgi:hypothetical protein
VGGARTHTSTYHVGNFFAASMPALAKIDWYALFRIETGKKAKNTLGRICRHIKNYGVEQNVGGMAPRLLFKAGIL